MANEMLRALQNILSIAMRMPSGWPPWIITYIPENKTSKRPGGKGQYVWAITRLPGENWRYAASDEAAVCGAYLSCEKLIYNNHAIHKCPSWKRYKANRLKSSQWPKPEAFERPQYVIYIREAEESGSRNLRGVISLSYSSVKYLRNAGTAL